MSDFVYFSLIFTAGTSIAGGMLAYLFMDGNGSGAAHKVSALDGRGFYRIDAYTVFPLLLTIDLLSKYSGGDLLWYCCTACSVP